MRALVKKVVLNLVSLVALAAYFMFLAADAQAQACKVNSVGSSIGPVDCANDLDNLAFVVDAANLSVPGACDLAPTLVCVFLPDSSTPDIGTVCAESGATAPLCTAAGGIAMPVPAGIVLNPGEFLRFSAVDDPGVTNCVLASDTNCEYIVAGMNYTAVHGDEIGNTWRASVCHKGTTVQNGQENQSSNQTNILAKHPDVDIEKSASPGKICEGTSTQVTYTYTVQWGPTATVLSNLNNVVVTDSHCCEGLNCSPGDPLTRGPDSPGNNNLILEQGEVWNYSCTTSISTETTNTATVNADDACTGLDVSDMDTLTVQANTCDDGVVCTKDSCQYDANNVPFCVFEPSAGNCNDLIDCTKDACNVVCTPTGCGQAGQPPCLDCAPATGANPVTGCVNVDTDLNCDDQIDCTKDACDPTLGPGTGCVNEPNNGNCNDSIECTKDACTPGAPGADLLTGCVFAANNANCDDEQFCNGMETCHPTLGCLDGADPVCNDGVPCTKDACDSTIDNMDGTFGACVAPPNDANCDDAQFCNGMETCHPTLGCLDGADPVCNDGVPCTKDACDPSIDNLNGTFGACVAPPNNVNCDDNQVCNGMETCHPTLGCLDGADPVCNDGVTCTKDACNSSIDNMNGTFGACVFVPTDGNCNDNNVCTTDMCVVVCTPTNCGQQGQPSCTDCNPGAGANPTTGCINTPSCVTNADCDDQDPCTIDVCDSDGPECCVYTDVPDQACCLPGGSCILDCPNECEAQGGVPQGPNSTCTLEACCLPNGTCLNLDPECCVELDGIPEGAGTQCGAIQACCLPNNTCVDLDPLCCLEQHGIPEGVGKLCTSVQACCLPSGKCAHMDPLCCIENGGLPEGEGTQCTELQACCLPDDTCTNMDPLCCVDEGGVPQGPGSHCTQPQACCLPNDTCADLDPECCAYQGGKSEGPGTDCSSVQGCCLADGSCQNLDPICCLDLDGEPQGFGSECAGVQGCCLPDNTCQDMDPLCCLSMNGTPEGPGSACSELQSCCLPSGKCANLDPLCCIDNGGVPGGSGTECSNLQACCLPDDTCNNRDPMCCIEAGGTPEGPGTLCINLQACCLPNGTCEDLDPLCCADQGGKSEGPGMLCSEPVGCCLPDGSCENLDPLCCTDQGGEVLTSQCTSPTCAGGQGCTPGYWHLIDDSQGNASHECNWTPPYVADNPHGDGFISGGTLFKNACVEDCTGGTLCFEDAFPGKTMRSVLKQGGGGLNALGRHTVAALLNASSPCVNYAFSGCQVVEMFNAAYPSNKDQYNALKGVLANENEMGCPLGNCNDGPCED